MKLSALPIILIGLAVGVVVLSYAFFHEFSPNTQQAENNNKHADALKTEGDKLPLAQKRVQDAETMVREREEAWAQVVARRTLPSDLGRGGINVNQNAWHLLIDARKFRNNVQRAVNAQVKRGGVTVINGPSIPFPTEDAREVLSSVFNYPAIPFPVVIYDLGTVTVRGTYKQITDNVRAWSSMPNYLAVADGLQLNGTSPNLIGTYNLSIVGYLEADGVYPPVPEGGGAQAAGAPGGPPGGPPAGLGAGGGGRPSPGALPGGPPAAAAPGGRGGAVVD